MASNRPQQSASGASSMPSTSSSSSGGAGNTSSGVGGGSNNVTSNGSSSGNVVPSRTLAAAGEGGLSSVPTMAAVSSSRGGFPSLSRPASSSSSRKKSLHQAPLHNGLLNSYEDKSNDFVWLVLRTVTLWAWKCILTKSSIVTAPNTVVSLSFQSNLLRNDRRGLHDKVWAQFLVSRFELFPSVDTMVLYWEQGSFV